MVITIEPITTHTNAIFPWTCEIESLISTTLHAHQLNRLNLSAIILLWQSIMLTAHKSTENQIR